MLKGSFTAAGIFFTECLAIKFIQNKLINSISLFFAQPCCRKKLVNLSSFKNVILVSNLCFFAFFLCVQIITILDRFSTRKLMQKSVMDMVLQ